MKIHIRQRLVGAIPVLEVVDYTKRNQLLASIIYYHGWQTNKELNLTQARKLARTGYRVILPDAANHGDRKQALSKVPGQTFWSSIQSNLFEFESLVEYFRTRDLLGEDIAVAGTSMGGMTACGLMVAQGQIKAGACIMGTPDYIGYLDRLTNYAEAMGVNLPAGYQQLLAWVPYFDLASQADKLADRPFLLWHGQADEKIPYEPVEDFARKNATSHLSFVSADEGHLVRPETMDLVTDFFSQNFPAS